MTKSKIGSNTTANIVSILALLLAIMSFIYTCNESKKRDKEVIEIASKKAFANEDLKFTKSVPNLLLHSHWETILTNNGEKTVSIKEYDVKCLENKENLMFYSGINQGIYDEELKPMMLPINIAPGESKRIYTKIGVRISKDASDIVLNEFDPSKKYSFRDLKIRLAKDSTDIFENNVKAKIKGDKILLWSLQNKDYNKDVYGITFTSGRNNKYYDILKWYPDFEDFY